MVRGGGELVVKGKQMVVGGLVGAEEEGSQR